VVAVAGVVVDWVLLVSDIVLDVAALLAMTVVEVFVAVLLDSEELLDSCEVDKSCFVVSGDNAEISTGCFEISVATFFELSAAELEDKALEDFWFAVVSGKFEIADAEYASSVLTENPVVVFVSSVVSVASFTVFSVVSSISSVLLSTF